MFSGHKQMNLQWRNCQSKSVCWVLYAPVRLNDMSRSQSTACHIEGLAEYVDNVILFQLCLMILYNRRGREVTRKFEAKYALVSAGQA
jgi:hypothetical protein